MQKFKKGFTLAEVLITLGIIGVVAALTIPSLIANYQKTQYVAGLKKAYAEITEALKLMANDHGCPGDLKCTGIFISSSPEGNTILGNELKKYFKLAKDCGTTYDANDESTKCLSDSVSNAFDGSVERTNMNTDKIGNYNFITADGFGISIYNYGCTNVYGFPSGFNLSQYCGEIDIDVNGLKGPNNWGRDIFNFWITNGKGPVLYPYGGPEWGPAWGIGDSWEVGSGNPCTTDNPDGQPCTGRIMDQSWQMNY